MTTHTISAFLIAIGIFLTGCQQPSKEKQPPSSPSVLRINIEDEPASLDPRKARSLTCGTILRMLFEGLTRVNQEDKAELALAQKVHISSDKKTYTFSLRRSKWSNGDPVTADDFVYSWKQTLDPNFPSDNAYQLYVIKNAKTAKEGKCPFEEVGVHAIDPLTLQIELESPISYFLELTAFPVYFPINRHIDQKNNQWALNGETYVCNGPFVIDRWKHHDSLDVKKNEQYWDSPTVQMAKIEMVMMTESTAFQMYEKNELDWVGSPLSVLPLDSIHLLKKEGMLRNKPMLGTYFLRLNTEDRLLKNPFIRKALGISINRGELVKHVLQGNQIPATGLVPPSMGLRHRPFFADGDDQQARLLFERGLQEEQLSREDFKSLHFTFAASERNRLIAQTLQQQWFETLGIQIQLESIETKVYFDRISKQDFQIASGSWIADFNDPINFLEVFKYKKNGTNNTHWENKEYVNLLDDSNLILDVESRYDVLKQSEEILIEAMPIIPIFHYTMLYVHQERLKEVAISSLGTMDFKWSHIENMR